MIPVVQGEHAFDNDLTSAEGAAISEMSRRVTADPVGEALGSELTMRLRFVHALGPRLDTVGRRESEVRKASGHWVSDGAAADLMVAPTAFGPVAAAFGLVEAQGRGCHPRVLRQLRRVSCGRS